MSLDIKIYISIYSIPVECATTVKVDTSLWHFQNIALFECPDIATSVPMMQVCGRTAYNKLSSWEHSARV